MKTTEKEQVYLRPRHASEHEKSRSGSVWIVTKERPAEQRGNSTLAHRVFMEPVYDLPPLFPKCFQPKLRTYTRTLRCSQQKYLQSCQTSAYRKLQLGTTELANKSLRNMPINSLSSFHVITPFKKKVKRFLEGPKPSPSLTAR
jgi:hypothetical protein